MSSVEFLMEQVQVEADARQDEVIRRLLETYNVNPVVCAYQALGAKLNKLKKQLKKADNYIGYLKQRGEWFENKLALGHFPSNRGLLVRKSREFKDVELQMRERLEALVESVGRVQLLFGQCRPCERCRACLSFAKLWRTTLWQRK